MAKRKRGRREPSGTDVKRVKVSPDNTAQDTVSHPVLSHYYSQTVTLRQYLLDSLPAESRKRRRAIKQLRTDSVLAPNPTDAGQEPRDIVDANAQHVRDLSSLLDTTIIAVDRTRERQPQQGLADLYQKQYRQYSQLDSTALANTALGSPAIKHADVVDFAIYLLFHHVHAAARHPPHLLCQGLSRANPGGQNLGHLIPGLTLLHPNEHLATLKGPLWAGALKLMGKNRDAVTLDLLLRCSIFVPVGGDRGNLYQLSGLPLADTPYLDDQALGGEPPRPKTKPEGTALKPSSIRFVRHRMLYARSSLTSRGEAFLGLRHFHVFNRYPDPSNPEHTKHILKYLFPRQFRLHNAFTSKVDVKDTSQPFMDYTLREKEIAWALRKRMCTGSQDTTRRRQDPVPKRLMGEAVHLVSRLQVLHARCRYRLLLDAHCPLPEETHSSQRQHQVGSPSVAPGICDLATTTRRVSAFVRAAVTRVFPRAWFGRGDDGRHNWKMLLGSIDRFLHARRFETFSLEEAMRGLRISNISWSAGAGSERGHKMALSDFSKRQELLSELVYYLFDSFVIPLVRSNFHVTETQPTRNRLAYFRHDVWRRLTEPTLTGLKTLTYEEIGGQKALDAIRDRQLSFSEIRLLPKEKGMRTITNLRRRPQTRIAGQTILGKSINTVLRPCLGVLNREMAAQPDRLRGSMFSVHGMLGQLKTFRASLGRERSEPLYLVKVDIKSCFDNLPHEKLLELVRKLLRSEDYEVVRRAEIKPPEGRASFAGDDIVRPSRTFKTRAYGYGDRGGIRQVTTELEQMERCNQVIVDHVVPQMVERDQLLKLIDEHIGQNVVRIGKKYFRQKKGIAQGSVLSSFLCSLIYADFERRRLSFLRQGGPSLLLRMIDDFLLVTTDGKMAQRFLAVMHRGDSQWGVSVKSNKTLVNFDAEVEGQALARTDSHAQFPFCGIMIDSSSLDIAKDHGRMGERSKQHFQALACATDTS